jgi:hypothetical protein
MLKKDRLPFLGGFLLLAGLAQAAQAATFHTNAIFNVSFALPGQLQNTFFLPKAPVFSLTRLWAIGPTNDPDAVITPTDANQRTIAFNSSLNHLYVVSRSSATTSSFVIRALNASSGAVVSELDTEGIYNGGAVGEGGIGLASIAVAADGAVYACNMSVDACGCGPDAGANPADSRFRIYRWANGNSNTAPVEIFSGDPAGQNTPDRWGDTLTVRGSGTNTEILLDNQQGSLVAILKPTDETMTTFASSALAGPPLGAGSGRSLQFGVTTNTIWQKREGSPLRLSKYNTTKHTFSSVSSFKRFSQTLGPVEIDFTRGVLAGIDFKGSAGTADVLDFYDVANPAVPSLLAQFDFPASQQSNPEFAGQVVFGGTRLWALDANNGLMAFSIQGPNSTAFYTAIAGSVSNAKIIQALIDALHSTNNLTGAKLLLKTTGLGNTNFSASFILRKGTLDVDVSAYLPIPTEPAAVSSETVSSDGTVTNITDYTITGFTLNCPTLRFDVQGFGIVKSSSIIDHGITIMAAPYPFSITATADGIATAAGSAMVVHGLVAITGRKIEIITTND